MDCIVHNGIEVKIRLSDEYFNAEQLSLSADGDYHAWYESTKEYLENGDIEVVDGVTWISPAMAIHLSSSMDTRLYFKVIGWQREFNAKKQQAAHQRLCCKNMREEINEEIKKLEENIKFLQSQLDCIEVIEGLIQG